MCRGRRVDTELLATDGARGGGGGKPREGDSDAELQRRVGIPRRKREQEGTGLRVSLGSGGTAEERSPSSAWIDRDIEGTPSAPPHGASAPCKWASGELRTVGWSGIGVMLQPPAGRRCAVNGYWWRVFWAGDASRAAIAAQRRLETRPPKAGEISVFFAAAFSRAQSRVSDIHRFGTQWPSPPGSR